MYTFNFNEFIKHPKVKKISNMTIVVNRISQYSNNEGLQSKLESAYLDDLINLLNHRHTRLYEQWTKFLETSK